MADNAASEMRLPRPGTPRVAPASSLKQWAGGLNNATAKLLALAVVLLGGAAYYP